MTEEEYQKITDAGNAALDILNKLKMSERATALSYLTGRMFGGKDFDHVPLDGALKLHCQQVPKYYELEHKERGHGVKTDSVN